MIDTSGKWWTGESAADIDAYLAIYSGNSVSDVKQIKCRQCGCDTLYVRLDRREGAMQVICPECKHKKILLDGEEVWNETKPKACHCPICKKRTAFHLKVGFVRRESGSVRWVVIGNMCAECHTLGSFTDWKVSYEPTDKMEENV